MRKASLALLYSFIALFSIAQSPGTDSIRNHQLDILLKTISQIKVSGFMEPEYQVAQTKGESTFSGGNFQPNSNNRFIIRRGRLRTTFTSVNREQQPLVQICMEIDGTQKGININEFWGRVYENKWRLFSVAAGMMVRPFGHEITWPTRDFESPERGRISQTLMRGEVDLGAMVVFEPLKKDNPLRYLKVSAGIFNGQGLTAPAEFDGGKDFIARIALKPVPLSKKIFLSGGLSLFSGSIEQNNRYIWQTADMPGGKINSVDSSVSNIGKKEPRQYYGADVQLKCLHAHGGATELRAEYWLGRQTATGSSSETPAALLQEPGYIRNFDGAFFYLLHSISAKHQLCVKYDWYDPNINAAGNAIGAAGTNFTMADIKYSTWGLGYTYYCNDNLKLMLWYDVVRNESTQLPGYTNDVKDNVFTCRLQFKF